MGVFLGWMPDAATQAALAQLRQRMHHVLPDIAPRLRWHLPAQWHMTLRYLSANVEPVQLAAIDAAMLSAARSCGAATSTLVDVQSWPSSNVLVAKAEGSPSLDALLGRLEALAQACGLAAAPPQVPHVTLARVPDTVAIPDVATGLAPRVQFTIPSVDLLRTVPGGYTSLASWPLAPGTPAG
jgi:2'-5' RNA ligase